MNKSLFVFIFGLLAVTLCLAHGSHAHDEASDPQDKNGYMKQGYYGFIQIRNDLPEIQPLLTVSGWRPRMTKTKTVLEQ